MLKEGVFKAEQHKSEELLKTAHMEYLQQLFYWSVFTKSLQENGEGIF